MLVARRFLAFVVATVLGIAALAALFIAVVDPYGVSPIAISVPRFNASKPKRVDIDRYLKPYEVWRYQPKTVFLGSSRVNQSLDPSVLQNSEYAPAYNAAIPASILQENVHNLETFFAVDHNLKHVFVELFFYNFSEPQKVSLALPSIAEARVALNFSAAALRDAFLTVIYNIGHSGQPAHTAANGQWIPASSFVPGGPFAGNFSDSILSQMHYGTPNFMAAKPEAIAALDRIVELCRQNGATVHLLILPHYPWDDYRLISVGYWPELTDWLRTMSHYPNVLSFSQSNALLEEPANPSGMQWWNDPIHPSAKFGRLILRAIKGERDLDMPEKLMEPITPSTVESVIAQRTAGVIAWAKQHPDFVATFDRAKLHYKPVDGALH